MHKGRLEAFSDGVLAIIITLMAIELKVPHGGTFDALRPMLPRFLAYLLSFLYVGIYWNNHHHLFQVVKRTNGRMLWANLHLLWWLSLVPFASGWMGENGFAPLPVALYGSILLAAGLAWQLLVRTAVTLHGDNSAVAHALKFELKGRLSAGLLLAATPLAFVHVALACTLYVLVALSWLVPNSHIEAEFHREDL